MATQRIQIMGESLEALRLSTQRAIDFLQDSLSGQSSTISLISTSNLQSYTTASRPTPSATWAGILIRVYDPPDAESIQCCIRKGNGSWSWVIVAQASPY